MIDYVDTIEINCKESKIDGALILLKSITMHETIAYFIDFIVEITFAKVSSDWSAD